MIFKTLTPNIFYTDIKTGLNLFVDCLGFAIGYDDIDSPRPFCVISNGNVKACLIQDAEYAAKDRPEFRLETDEIEAVYKEVSEKHAHLLHPNGNRVTLKPWGAKEFALIDASGVCVIIQQW